MILLALNAQSVGLQVLLLNDSSDPTLTAGSCVLNGRSGAVIKDEAFNLKQLFLGDRILLRENGTALLQAARTPVWVAAVYAADALALYGENLLGLSIYGPGVDPLKVRINDQPATVVKTSDYIVVGAGLFISVPNGGTAPSKPSLGNKPG